jgi:hypothetical protein
MIMEIFHPWDDDKPVEEYPGYLGCTWDGELYPGPKLKILQTFNWAHYLNLINELEVARCLSLSELLYSVECTIEPGSDLAFLLDQLPSIEVKYDDGPSNSNPASGSGFFFFLADGVSLQCLDTELLALKHALDLDLKYLSENMPCR